MFDLQSRGGTLSKIRGLSEDWSKRQREGIGEGVPRERSEMKSESSDLMIIILYVLLL